jgi:hypothetical protein
MNMRNLLAACLFCGCALTLSAQQPANPLPQPAINGPSLTVTMQFIQDKLNDLGKISFVVYLQSTSQGNTWTATVTNEISNVMADQNQCRISYHWRGTDLEALPVGGTAPRRKFEVSPHIDAFTDVYPLMLAAERKASSQAFRDLDYVFSLRSVQEIVVKPYEQYGIERLAKNGHPDTIVTSTSPPMTALVVRQPHGVENVIIFTDASLADRVAKAMVHAVELCGGGKTEEPF